MRSSVPITLLIAIQFLMCQAAADESAVTQEQAIAAFERGKRLLAAGEVDEAIKQLKLGTQSVEKEALARANLARAYFDKGETEQARKTAAEAVFVGGKRIRKAVADGTILAQLYVDRGFAWLVRREVLGEELAREDSPYDGDGLLETAIEDFERAIELEPECFHAHRLLAAAQLSLRKYGKSIEACDKAIALQPKCLELYSYKANASLESERGRALGELMVWALSKLGEEKGSPLPEGTANGLRALVRHSVGSQGWEEALAACNAALEIEPQSPEFLLLRACAYSRGDRHDEALADCDQVISLEPKDATIYLFRGELLILNNDLCAALEEFERAARLDSQTMAQPRWLDRLNDSRQEFDSIAEEKTMVLVERICAAAPEVGEVHLLRAIVNRAYKHEDAAKIEYKKAFDVGLSVASRKYFREME